MPGRATPAARAEASVAESSGTVANNRSSNVRQYFGDFNNQQLQTLAHELGEWETETSCVRKNCAHRPPSMCWNQDPVYPIDTKQPSFYLPGVIESLPESLSKTRKQWMYTCLLAKHYRVPISLSFSPIKPYNNLISPIQKARKKHVSLDAYMVCIMYTVGQFIDTREILLDRLGFLKPYPSKSHQGFDWKFEENQDRVFCWYDDGQWEEHPADEDPDDEDLRHVKVEVTLVYSRFLGLANAEGGAHVNEFQKEVARALKTMSREESEDPNDEAADSERERGGHFEELLSHSLQAQQPPIAGPANHLRVFEAKLNDALKDLFEAQGAQPREENGLERDTGSALMADGNSAVRGAENLNNEDYPVANEEMNHIHAAAKEGTSEAHRTSPKPAKQEILESNATSIKIKHETDSKADIENVRLREAVQRYQREAATMKRKFDEAFQELGQQREQHNRMVQDSKKNLSRSNKRQKLLHVHVESIYNKWDTGKLLQDGENDSELVMDHVHEALDLRAKIRKILELEDQDSARQQLQDWATRREATMDERMDALEKLLTSESLARSMDVATELKESYSTWVKSVKPRLEMEPPNA
ncbi:uncharacterized protein PG986_001164 [Apiospora aurea]|uniref:Uncharacterized protein n=1 Tax=Apiospora aurea TaxID=335848 RepID=A0ABR1QWQ0_9PEZI